MHSITSAVDFSKEALVVKEGKTHDAGVFEKVEAEVVKLLKEPPSHWWSHPKNLGALPAVLIWGVVGLVTKIPSKQLRVKS